MAHTAHNPAAQLLGAMRAHVTLLHDDGHFENVAHDFHSSHFIAACLKTPSALEIAGRPFMVRHEARGSFLGWHTRSCGLVLSFNARPSVSIYPPLNLTLERFKDR